MKLRDLNKDVANLKKQKPLSNENRKKLRDTLADMSDVIENFEKTGEIATKLEREKVGVKRSAKVGS